MDIKEVRKVVSKIQTTLFKNSNSYSVGNLKSHFKGTGLKFKEHRVYEIGDDVRFIDWKLLAKTQTPYIKTFEEERNVEIVILIDASPTMMFGYEGVSKLRASLEICSLFYLLSKNSGDFVNALVITDKIIEIPLSSGEEGITRLISALETDGLLNSDGSLNLKCIERKPLDIQTKESKILRKLQKRKEVVVLSDYHNFVSKDFLKRLAYTQNVHMYQIVSPLDETNKIPFQILSKTIAGKQKQSSINSSGSVNRLEWLSKRAPKIRVDNRYLEDFIKWMV